MNGPTSADVARWLDELESDDPAYRMEALGKWAEGWRARAETAEAENQRLREAIADALTDLTPGYAPYTLLATAIGEKP
jgi:hypothetical protein